MVRLLRRLLVSPVPAWLVGSIGGSVTINGGGFISPATIGSIGTLTISGNLSFNGGTYRADLNSATSDRINVGGIINMQDLTQGIYQFSYAGGVPAYGTVFMLIDNQGGQPIIKAPLVGAAEGGIVTLGGRPARYTYSDGPQDNDFTLTVLQPGTDYGDAPAS